MKASDKEPASGAQWRRASTIGIIAALLLAEALPARTVLAETSAPKEIPGRVLPVPDSVSPEMQRAIANNVLQEYRAKIEAGTIKPVSAADLQTFQARQHKEMVNLLGQWRARFHLTLAEETFGGVRCYLITPARIAPNNRNRTIVVFHGGGYTDGAGEAGTRDAIQTAALTDLKVISVDYRLAPEYPFPAAIDDAMAVWKALIRRTRPANIGVYGNSAGGGLALAFVLRAKREGVALPAAVAVGSPLADMTKTGDSYFTNAGVDNTIGTYEFSAGDTVKKYASGHDLRDPMVSPVYGDFADFPPTFLVTGTRDLFLSNTIRVHEKLRRAGVDAQLRVYDGQSHDQFLLMPGDRHVPDAPETHELFADMARFFDAHIAR